MARNNDGWSVFRHNCDRSHFILLPGGSGGQPLGYHFVAWTAGNKQDGRNLLAEITAKYQEAK